MRYLNGHAFANPDTTTACSHSVLPAGNQPDAAADVPVHAHVQPIRGRFDSKARARCRYLPCDQTNFKMPPMASWRLRPAVMKEPPLMQVTFESVSISDLTAIAKNLIQHFPSPLAIGLVGTLGAGKTTLVQSIAHAAGVDMAEVTSPTFTLLQTHQGKSIRLHHIDAYRLTDDDEFYELGVDELLDDPDGWTVVEWADRFASCMPPQTLWIQIELTDQPDRRRLNFRCSDESIIARVQDLAP